MAEISVVRLEFAGILRFASGWDGRYVATGTADRHSADIGPKLRGTVFGSGGTLLNCDRTPEMDCAAATVFIDF
jgi:hypothetical protein